MRIACVLVLVLAISGCKGDRSKPASGFDGKGSVASCDLRAEKGDDHHCTDVLDPELVASQEQFCNELAVPGAKVAFTRGKACPTEGRLGGCVEPNGTVRWTYKGQETCAAGLKFKGGTMPKLNMPGTFRCGNDKICVEQTSRLDLAQTAFKSDCVERGATFDVGSCPTANVVGKCTIRDRSGDSLRSYYAPGVPAAGAKEDCEVANGTFVEPAGAPAAPAPAPAPAPATP